MGQNIIELNTNEVAAVSGALNDVFYAALTAVAVYGVILYSGWPPERVFGETSVDEKGVTWSSVSLGSKDFHNCVYFGEQVIALLEYAVRWKNIKKTAVIFGVFMVAQLVVSTIG